MPPVNTIKDPKLIAGRYLLIYQFKNSEKNVAWLKTAEPFLMENM